MDHSSPRTGAFEKAYMDKRNEEREKERRTREGNILFIQQTAA